MLLSLAPFHLLSFAPASPCALNTLPHYLSFFKTHLHFFPAPLKLILRAASAFSKFIFVYLPFLSLYPFPFLPIVLFHFRLWTCSQRRAASKRFYYLSPKNFRLLANKTWWYAPFFSIKFKFLLTSNHLHGSCPFYLSIFLLCFNFLTIPRSPFVQFPTGSLALLHSLMHRILSL